MEPLRFHIAYTFHYSQRHSAFRWCLWRLTSTTRPPPTGGRYTRKGIRVLGIFPVPPFSTGRGKLDLRSSPSRLDLFLLAARLLLNSFMLSPFPRSSSPLGRSSQSENGAQKGGEKRKRKTDTMVHALSESKQL